MKPFTIEVATENNMLETSFEEKEAIKEKMVKPFVVDEEVEKKEENSISKSDLLPLFQMRRWRWQICLCQQKIL